MTLEDLLKKIDALPLIGKIGLLVGILIAIAGGYWYWFYGDIVDEHSKNDRAIAQAKTDKKDYEKRKTEYLAFRNEVNQLLEEQKELLRVLPKRDDIEQFIESVNAQVELSGLSKVSSKREKAITEELYQRIPITMSLIGSYHQINRFFKNIGELQRIVTIADLQLNEAEGHSQTGGGALKADFVAQTFQFIDRPAGAHRKPAAAAPGAAK